MRRGVRRMVESAAHLLDHVVPDVPMHQWVLSFRWPLRVLFAERPDWLSRILGIVTRALSSGVGRRACLRRGDGAETGAITFIQRHGSALNLNVHFHHLVPDGAYAFEHGKAHFHRANTPLFSLVVLLQSEAQQSPIRIKALASGNRTR